VIFTQPRFLEESNQKHSVYYDSSKDVMKETTLQFPSLSCGIMPGTHQVLFDSYVDSISFTHTARSREGFDYIDFGGLSDLEALFTIIQEDTDPAKQSIEDFIG
jgi:hypothetical protein